MDNQPVPVEHHQRWDEKVRTIAGGLTIFKPAMGQWINEEDQKLFSEKMIPVRVACSRKQIEKIVAFTITHYNQLAVMAYKISSEVIITHDKSRQN